MKSIIKYITTFFKGLLSLLTGMKVTLREFFTKKTTEQYPENRATLKMFDRFRGELVMPHDENNHHKCIACGICEMNCPNGTIKVTSELVTDEAGKKKKEMYFRFGHWYLGLYPTLHTGQKRITEEIPLRITENFILPVWIGWTETTDYTIKEETYTRKEAEKEAVRRFHQYEKKLLQNGIKISENHITTRLTESLCITGGTLLIIEQTGEKSRIT